eukprot:2691912-Amphidinium_carterae.1
MRRAAKKSSLYTGNKMTKTITVATCKSIILFWALARLLVSSHFWSWATCRNAFGEETCAKRCTPPSAMTRASLVKQSQACTHYH